MSSMVTSSTSASTDEPEVRLAKCAFADAEIARLRQELEAQKASTAAFRDHLPKFHGVAIGALGKLVNYAKRNDILKKNNSALRKHAAKMAKVHDKIVQGYNPAELARLSRSVLSSLEEDEDMPPLPGRARTAGEGAGESTGEGAGESTGEEAGESAEAASHEEAIALLELLINEQTTGPHPERLPLPRPARAPAVRVRKGSGSGNGNGRGSASIDAETEAFNSRFASLIARSAEEAEAGVASSIHGKKRDSVRKQQTEMQLKKAEVMKKLKREMEIEEEGEGEEKEKKKEEENMEVNQKKSKAAANKTAVKKSIPATPAKNLIQLMLEEDEAGASIPKKRRIKIELATRDDDDLVTSSSSSAPSAPKVTIPKKEVEFSLFRVKQEMASDDEE